LRRNGRTRTLRPRHIVMATGVSGIPHVPEIPGLKNFAGQVVHSHGYDDASEWQGRDALVIGTGNSGHDIAQDLLSSGGARDARAAQARLDRQHRAERPAAYALYGEGPPLEDCDLLTASVPLALLRKAHRAWAEQSEGLRPRTPRG